MFYLSKEDWSPRFDPTFFTIDFGPRMKCDTFQDIEWAEDIGGNTHHPAIYYKVIILCGRQSRTLLRRYSQFYHLYKQLLHDPPKESVLGKVSGNNHPLSIPPRTCFFQHGDEDFLDEREKDLEFFLKDLLGRQGYVEHPAVQAFLELPFDETR